MARDYAKNSRGSARRKPAKRQAAARSSNTQATGASGWRLYGAGVATGVFLSFLVYLGTLPGANPPERPSAGPGQTEAQPPKPRFDFYTLLPEQTIDVDVAPSELEPAEDVGKPLPAAAAREVYLLQAGSFRQREDADRRRAELLLLGLEPSVEETSTDNGRWYRVYLGPFESRNSMNRARGLTANQDIDTLLLKRERS